MLRYLTMHGHFYQPPRDDPFTGQLPCEDGAAPYHDFNEKITAECYRPNAEMGNFERISFDIGPTLAGWLQKEAADVHGRIVGADQANLARHGHGNALAQPYNHTILPLDNRRDKVTQVRWGIADYAYRYGHRPEGMWLPETAVDHETLEVLAENGIRFTILGPHQAREGVDPRRPYWVHLGGERRIAIFFYEQHVSFETAFVPEATDDAGRFTSRLVEPRLAGGTPDGGDPLLLVASDGELYGHHHARKEHFLRYLTAEELPRRGIQPISLSHYLSLHPPRFEADIVDNTSWSCEHGVRRWTEGCECTPADDWWKRPTRAALGHLAREIDRLGEEESRGLLRDFWQARDRYIVVLLGEMTGQEFLAEQATRALTTEEECRLLSLFAAQVQRQRMFTSCTFFWEAPDGIEAHDMLRAVTRAIDLVRQATGISLQEGFEQEMRQVVSPHTGRNGVDLYHDVARRTTRRCGSRGIRARGSERGSARAGHPQQ